MDLQLFCQAIMKFLMGLLLVGALIFLPAGTFAYPQGWLLIGILFIPMFAAGLVMMKKSPDLLRRRLNAKEEQDEQKTVMLLYIPIIAKRIRNEEQVLESGLDGYTEYKKKVRYKVIPFVW